MVVYHNVLEKLKEKGWTTYTLRKPDSPIPWSVIQRIEKGDPVTITSIDKICQMTGLPICQIVTCELEPKEKTVGD